MVTRLTGGNLDTVRLFERPIHDIRRTGATNPQALGIPIEVTEAVLNHISDARPGVAGICKRHSYEPQKARGSRQLGCAAAVTVAEETAEAAKQLYKW